MIDDISNLGLGHDGHKLFNYFLLTYFYTSLCESHSQIERTQRVTAILIFSLEQKNKQAMLCCAQERSEHDHLTTTEHDKQRHTD